MKTAFSRLNYIYKALHRLEADYKNSFKKLRLGKKSFGI